MLNFATLALSSSEIIDFVKDKDGISHVEPSSRLDQVEKLLSAPINPVYFLYTENRVGYIDGQLFEFRTHNREYEEACRNVVHPYAILSH